MEAQLLPVRLRAYLVVCVHRAVTRPKTDTSNEDIRTRELTYELQVFQSLKIINESGQMSRRLTRGEDKLSLGIGTRGGPFPAPAFQLLFLYSLYVFRDIYDARSVPYTLYYQAVSTKFHVSRFENTMLNTWFDTVVRCSGVGKSSMSRNPLRGRLRIRKSRSRKSVY